MEHWIWHGLPWKMNSSAEIAYEAVGEVKGLVAGVGQRVLLGVAKHLVRQFFSTLFDAN